ncbi:MAG: hypothetical protein KA586_09415 [Candidatus Promineofilum sp.]|nr:hypothetical protein [Promineifilum sp.]
MFIPSRSPEPDDELARSIIAAEYGYIAQTAFQANEDRARAWQYFFVTFATLIAALLSTQVAAAVRQQLYLTFVVIFSLLAVLGLITVLQLVRLRQAWLESARAMNQIKARLIADDPALAAYFRWRDETLPAAFKWRSFGFLQAVSVALLSGLAVGAAVAFGALAGGEVVVPWLPSLSSAALAAGGILWLGYIAPLRRAPPASPGPEASPAAK